MLRLEILLQAVDRLTAPMRAVEARMAAVGAAARRIGQESGATRLAGSLRNVATQAGQATSAILRLTGTAAGVGTVAAGGAALGFNSQFLRPAAEAERMMITLRNQLGQQRAEQAFAWVNDFAERTPYALAEVQGAFVALNNLGINPMSGGLQAVGDAAAIMGGSYAEAVTAFAAAMRGEMEPLARFGVSGRTENGRTTLRWRNREGQDQAAVVNQDDREGMAGALQTALNSKFAGGMEELSKSWDGLMSNLGDAWRRFTGMVMQAGVFDWMKEQLEEVLARVNAMAADGTLRAWAEDVAASILLAFQAIRRFLVGTDKEPAGITSIKDAVTDIIGVFERVRAEVERFTGPLSAAEFYLGALAVTLAAPLAAPLLALAAAILRVSAALVPFTLAFAASPLGLFLIGLGAALLLIVTYWDDIAAAARVAFSAMDRILPSRSEPNPQMTPEAQAERRANGARRGARRIDDAEWNAPDAPPPSPLDLMSRAAGQAGGAPSPATATAAPRPAAAAPPAPVRVETGGQLNIRVEDGRAPQVTARPNNPQERWSILQGPRLVTP